MKIFTVHLNPEDKNPASGVLLTREGFAPWAFILPLLWALYHKCWWLAAVLLAFNLSLPAIVQASPLQDYSAMVLSLAFNIWVGFNAWDIKRFHLRQRGYIMSNIISGLSEDHARRRYFDHIS